MVKSLILLMLIASSALAQPQKIDGDRSERTEFAPQEVVEGARKYIVGLLGPDIGSTCTVTACQTTAVRYGGSGPIGIGVWYLLVKFRPRLMWDEECRFPLEAPSGEEKYFSIISLGSQTGYMGEIPDCAHRPELCEIEIDREAAIDIARSRGIDPELGEFHVELTLYREPNLVWKVESKPGNGALPHRIIIDAVSGGILRDFEGSPCN